MACPTRLTHSFEMQFLHRDRGNRQRDAGAFRNWVCGIHKWAHLQRTGVKIPSTIPRKTAASPSPRD
jgi:hypothetical protein